MDKTNMKKEIYHKGKDRLCMKMVEVVKTKICNATLFGYNLKANTS